MTVAQVPTLVVQFAPGDTPLDTTQTWVEITSYVLDPASVTIQRGRQSEADHYSAGRLTLTLDNRSRIFDPAWTAGTYYGQLVPRVQIRVQATWSGNTVTMFQGHIVGWPQRFGTGGKGATVPIEAFDGLAWLAETFLGDPVEDYAEVVGGVLAFWRQATDTAWSDTVGGAPGFPFNEATTGESLCDGSESPSLVFVDSTAWVLPLQTTGMTLSFWIQTTTVGASASVWDQVFGLNNTSSTGSRVGVDSVGRICAESLDYNPGTFVACRSSVAINNGQPHHVVFVNNAGTGVVYVDGVNVTVTDATGSAGDGWPCEVVGAPSGDYVASSGEFVGSLQDVLLSSEVWTAAEVLAFYNLQRNALAETTTVRAGRVLDVVGWPASWRDLTAAPYGTCAAPWAAGDTCLAHLQAVAATEQGRLFATKANAVALRPRYYHQTVTGGTTSQATFSDDGAAVRYQMVGLDYSDIDVANSITVSAEGVGSYTSTDATSVGAYGLQSRSISTLLPTVADAKSMAEGLVYWFKTPAQRCTPLTVMPAAQTAHWATLLGLELGERVTVEVTPSGVGTQTVLPILLEQIGWAINADNWVLTIQGSPVPSSFLVLDTDVLDTGRLGF